MNDRIRLAEAMGWKQLRGMYRWLHDDFDETRAGKDLPNPFTDANDDYACLEFAREQHWVAYMEYYLCMIGESRTDYKVGDYARALLGVIDHEDD